MASKNSKAKPTSKGKAARKNDQKKREPPKNDARRRNAAPVPATTRPVVDAVDTSAEDERRAFTERMDEMGGSHMGACVAAGALGNALGVVMVGQGWIPPKLIATLMIGAGAATTGAGWYWDMDHMMAAGAGVTAAGAFSMANQVAVDAYEAMEKRADEKRAEREAKQAAADEAKRLAEARALLEAEKNRTRNGRRFVLVDENGDPQDFRLLDVA